MAEFSEAKNSAFPQRIVLISLHLVITCTVWTTYEIDPYHVQLFLNHVVSEAAKTFGKSQNATFFCDNYLYIIEYIILNSLSLPLFPFCFAITEGRAQTGTAPHPL
jgi:hypothetical protein